MELTLVNKHRKFIMGVAAFWIALYHTVFFDFREIDFLNTLHISSILEYGKRFGNVGVDAFLILSGIGLYYSFSKNPDLISFYKKRFFRVFPSSFIIVVVLCGFVGANSVLRYLSQITFVDFFFYSEIPEIAWFVTGILVFYLVFPVIYSLTKRFGIYFTIVFSLITIALTLLLSVSAPEYFTRVSVFVCRIPAFIIGVYLGKLFMKGIKVKRWFYIVILIFFICYSVLAVNLIILIQHSHHFLRYYIQLPVALSFIFAFAFIREIIGSHIITRSFELLGMYSLEFYLIHVNIYQYCLKFFNTDEVTGFRYAVTCYVVAFVLAVLVKTVADKVSGYLMFAPTQEK